MDFEVAWNESKRLNNIKEHGVDFIKAALIFKAPLLCCEEDARKDYGERRFCALGSVDDDYFVVVFTERGSARRIISAWRVGEDGKERYQKVLARRAAGTLRSG